MKGVKKANKKFQSQFEAVANAPCLARVLVGNVSPIRIHMPGAYEELSTCYHAKRESVALTQVIA